MKNFIVGVVVLLATLLNAEPYTRVYEAENPTHANYSPNPSTERVDESGKETFFYEKGYRRGHAVGEKEGFARGLKAAERSITRFKNKIKSMEAGKYLTKRHKLTPPRLYQKKNPDGSVSVVVKGCAIEKQLSPNDILMLPDVSNELASTYGEHPTSGASPSDNIFLPGIDEEKYAAPTLSGNAIKTVYRFFPDTGFYRQLFRASSKPFSIVADDRIKVIFNSEREANEFAVRHNLKSGRDVF